MGSSGAKRRSGSSSGSILADASQPIVLAIFSRVVIALTVLQRKQMAPRSVEQQAAAAYPVTAAAATPAMLRVPAGFRVDALVEGALQRGGEVVGAAAGARRA
jgi:hypothetical protein